MKYVWLTDWINNPDDKLIIQYGLVRWRNENELNHVGEMQGSEEEKRLIKEIVQGKNQLTGQKK